MITERKTNATTQENKKIFLRETTRDTTPQNFLSIEFNQDSVKIHTKSSSFFLVCYHFSLLLRTTWVSTYKWRGAPSYLYSSVELTSNLVGPTSLAIQDYMSNWNLHKEFIIMTLGYYWPDLQWRIYLMTFTWPITSRTSLNGGRTSPKGNTTKVQ